MLLHQRRATPQLLAVPFAMPALPCPEPNEQDNAGQIDENPVDPVVDDGRAMDSQSAAAAGQRNRGYDCPESGLRGSDTDNPSELGGCVSARQCAKGYGCKTISANTPHVTPLGIC
jgi:hypothetical protein